MDALEVTDMLHLLNEMYGHDGEHGMRQYLQFEDCIFRWDWTSKASLQYSYSHIFQTKTASN